MDFLELVRVFTGLVGLPAFVTALVNMGKRVGLVRDGASASWSLGMNVVGFVLLYLGILRGMDFSAIDASLGSAATIVVSVAHLMGQLGVSANIHRFVRGIPLLGHSFS